MSNGESPDGFVFPPFIPPSAARPAAAPAPASAPQPPLPAPPADAPPRVEMPWELESPAAADEAAPATAEAEAPAASADLDELPWLELPEPREAPAAEENAAAEHAEPAGSLPEWMTWDARAEAEAEAELAGIPRVEGLEDYDAADGLGIAGEPLADAFPYGEPEPEPAGRAADVGAPEDEDEGEDEDGLSGLELEDAFAALDGEEPEDGGETAAPAAAAEQGFAPDRFEDPFVEAFAATAEAAPFVADDEAVMAAEPGPSSGAEPAHAAGAFDEVAARLEEIARALRERPEALLAGGGDDPLALLVTGYVMGFTHGRRG